MELRMGFSGTRYGMTNGQSKKVAEIINWFRPQEFHHGDCIGSDAEAHEIVSKHEYIWTVGHPPIDDSKRAFCKFDQERLAQEYKARDRRIVIESNILVATPKDPFEVLHSGTWTTIRYGLEANIPVLIVRADGTLMVKGLFGLSGILEY